MSRLEVQKTYKIYIAGAFPRTESGRFYPVKLKNGTVTNICLSSRKDARNAVVAARNAFEGWSSRAAFNRSQILYRIAEMLEGRKAQFIEELIAVGSSKASAQKEVEASIDRCVYFAGWCDKYTQLFGSVNPVASSHFNFSVQEPTGVVTIIAPESPSLLGLVSAIMPVIAGGNTCVVLASENSPHVAVTFAEVLNSSDVPGGVINILTGKEDELVEHFSSHMDVNATIYCREKHLTKIKENASLNVKRVSDWSGKDWFKDGDDPYLLLEMQEVKTTWHPIENIAGTKSGY
ncbi:MAG: aldehyde dehydrogenase family protein [Flavobacteriales bacterium]|jgi:acyl-CoA reductase-like NAD-dependent aldehyde dehydrogenase|nr:aldehyde dehydrogenase family protein [Flavobacteriales bacterium]